VANVRIRGTTAEAPIPRFERDEAHRLKPLGGNPSFGSLREVTRVAGHDCAVEIDTNSYSVPWRLIGERLAVTVAAGEVRTRHGVRGAAVHRRSRSPSADGRFRSPRRCCRSRGRCLPTGDRGTDGVGGDRLVRHLSRQDAHEIDGLALGTPAALSCTVFPDLEFRMVAAMPADHEIECVVLDTHNDLVDHPLPAARIVHRYA
jgi:hypothetical protein